MGVVVGGVASLGLCVGLAGLRLAQRLAGHFRGGLGGRARPAPAPARRPRVQAGARPRHRRPGRRSSRSSSRRRPRRSPPAGRSPRCRRPRTTPLAPELAKPRVSVVASTPTTWAFWVRWIQVTRRRCLVASTMSGHSRRTSTRLRLEPATGAAGASAGAAVAGSGSGGSGSGSGSGAGVGSGSGAAAAAGAGAAAAAGARGPGRRLRRRRTADLNALLEPVEPGLHAQGRVVGAGQQHPRADQLQQQPGSRGAAHLGQAGGHQVGRPAQLGLAEARRLRDQSLALVLGHVDQPAHRRVRHRGHDHQVADPAEQVFGEAARVLPGLDDLVDDPEHRRAVPGGERVDDLVEERVGGIAEQPAGELMGDPGRAGPAQQLVEHREGVAGGAGARAHHEGQRGRLDRDAFLLAQLGEVRRQQPRRDQPERVVMGPRPDRRDHLVGLGRREDEPQVRWRLLDQLEQGVEALRGDHVGLVDDVDLVATADRCEERLLPQLAGVIDAAVRGGVDLDHVDRARAVAGQLDAAVALAARVGHRRLVAVERPGQDPRRGGLAAPAGAGEEVGVVDPVARQRRS